jgi:hypothetical protein
MAGPTDPAEISILRRLRSLFGIESGQVLLTADFFHPFDDLPSFLALHDGRLAECWVSSLQRGAFHRCMGLILLSLPEAPAQQMPTLGLNGSQHNVLY